MTAEVKHRLDYWTCYFLNSKSHTFSSQNKNYTYFCKSNGYYLAGNDGAGHALSIFLCVLILVIALFGTLTNIGTIIIVRKSLFGKGTTSFKESLALLAIVELVLCVATVGFSVFIVLILGNYSRDALTIHLFRICNITTTLARTVSVFFTILITVERYIVVAFPTQSKNWFDCSPWKCRITLLAVLFFSISIKLPWICKTTIKANPFYIEEFIISSESTSSDSNNSSMRFTSSPELEQFPYLIQRNTFGKSLKKWMQEMLLVVDVLVPLPVLVIFNGLIYKSIHHWSKTRSSLSTSQRREIHAAKMFCVVVLVLLSSHSVFSIVYFTSRFQQVIYRELLLLQSLGVVFGAAANFHVYYLLGSGFQQEFWKCMIHLFGERFQWIVKHHEKHNIKKNPPSSPPSQIVS